MNITDIIGRCWQVVFWCEPDSTAHVTTASIVRGDCPRTVQDCDMARLELTPHLSRHLHCEPFAAPAATVRDLLGIAFTRCPELQTYLLDEHGCVRPHVVIFLDGQPIRDRQQQSDTVQEQSSVFVMQALSGG